MSEQTTLPEQPEQAAHEGLVDRVKRDRRLQLEVAGGIGLLVLGFVFGNLGDLTSPSASDTAIVQPRNQVLFDLTWEQQSQATRDYICAQGREEGFEVVGAKLADAAVDDFPVSEATELIRAKC